jgi:hypothetical protein
VNIYAIRCGRALYAVTYDQAAWHGLKPLNLTRVLLCEFAR